MALPRGGPSYCLVDIAGRPASKLTHRDTLNAFEGIVENRDLVEIYIPAIDPGSNKVVGVFEIYSDVTPFLAQIQKTSAEIQQAGTENQARLDRIVAASAATADKYAKMMLAVVLGLLGLLYSALFLIVRNGQRIIDRERIERMRAEQILRAREERYRILFDRASDGIVILSLSNNLFSVNESFARMHGYTTKEMQNLTLKDLDTPETHRLVPEKMQRILAGESMTFEVEHYHKDGHIIPLEVSSSLISTDGEPLIQAFHRDITERNRQRNLITEHNALLTQRKAELEEMLGRIKRLEGFISICMQCKKIRAEDDDWHQLERYIGEHSDAVFSHGLCPECFEQQKRCLA